MSAVDEYRDARNSKRWKPYWLAKADAAIAELEAPHACDGCRHWTGEPGTAGLGKCLVSGSFRAPGGLFTEGGFRCCHWAKR